MSAGPAHVLSTALAGYLKSNTHEILGTCTLFHAESKFSNAIRLNCFVLL